MRMNTLKLLSATLSIAMLAACGTPAASTPATPAAPASVSPSSGSATTTADYSNTTLVIYSNSAAEGRGEWLTERAKQDGFKLEIVSISGGDLLNRIIAEKNNQIADIVFGMNPMQFDRVKSQDMLVSFEPSWMNEVDMNLGDAKGHTYFPLITQPLILAYNTDVYTKETAPKDFIDLATNPAFANKYYILALGGGTAQNCIGGIMQYYKDPNGELGVSKEGWDVMKSYVQNGIIPAEGEDWFGKTVSGEVPLTLIWGSGYIQNLEKLKADNIDFVTPSTGVPYVTEQVAVFKNSKNIEAGKAFVDWFGTAKIQGEWTQKFGSAPVQPEALKLAPTAVQEMMGRLTPQDYDWSFMGENIEKWMEKIQLEFVK